MDISQLRQEYTKLGLSKESLESDPHKQFEKWFFEYEKYTRTMPNCMTLATVSKESIPSLRVVLLKKFDENGFVFFTNYNSEKALHINENPFVSLLFFWDNLERQVIIKDKAEKVSNKESEEYFLSRPYESQIGAWVSHQSEVIADSSVLKNKFKKFKNKYPEGKVPYPKFWGGYFVKPIAFEFWQGRTCRLHDRFRYQLINQKNWKIDRLAP